MADKSPTSAAVLRDARLRAGLTQEQLAEKAGVATRTVRNLERGRTRPRLGSLTALSAALNLTDSERHALLQQPTPEAVSTAPAVDRPSVRPQSPPTDQHLPDQRPPDQRPPDQRPPDQHAPDQHPAGPASVAHHPPVPRQLPLEGFGFSGRTTDLARLDHGLSAGRIAVVVGPAGVGKTALALHWAHRASDRFPDGQLYADLQGFAPGAEPAKPERVLRDLLFALNVPAARIPAGLDELAKLLRGVLADRRVLILLDDARSVEQVRPLLPGHRACAVIVTSRAPLTGLATVEGALAVPLDVLAREQAAALLERRLGPDRPADADSKAVRAIVERCAGLPLALAVVAARMSWRPDVTLDTVAAELGAALDAVARWDPQADLRSVFSWSYQALSSDAAQLFRSLGWHFGPDITLTAAASLIGKHPRRTADALAELCGVSLLVEGAGGRFRTHDLLRAYARELSDVLDGPFAIDQAVTRLLDHYVHTAHRAALLLSPEREPIPLEPAAPGSLVTPLEGSDDAWAWMSHEQAAIRQAARHTGWSGADQADRAEKVGWRLAWSMVFFFGRSGRWYDWLELQQVTLESATRSGDPTAMTHARFGISWVEALLGRFEAANAHLARAVAAQPDGFDDGLITCWVLEAQGRWEEAREAARRGTNLARARGSRAALAIALNALAWCHVHLGDDQAAVACGQEALALHVNDGRVLGEANTLDTLGYAHQRAGRFAQSIGPLRRARTIFEEAGNRVHTAHADAHLGDAFAALGHRQKAEQHWRAALAVYEHTSLRDADDIERRLADQRPG